MRFEGPRAKRQIGVATGIVALVLAGASFAWACFPGDWRIEAGTGEGVPGTQVTLTGYALPPGQANILLTSESGYLAQLGTTTVSGDGDMSVKVTIPTGLAAGDYSIYTRIGNTTSITGEMFTVTAPRTSQPTPAPTPGPAPGPTAEQPNQSTTGQPQPTNNGQGTTQQPQTSPEVASQTPAQQPVPVAPQAATPASGSPALAEAPVQPVVTAPVFAPGGGLTQALTPQTAWSGADPATPAKRPALVDDPASGDSSNQLLVGAGLLAVGSVALFAGFTVVVVRRRRARAHASIDW